MTSSTKPEVHNVLQGRQRRTEPRPQVTRTENVAKFGRVVSEIRETRDRQTDLLIATLRTPIDGDVNRPFQQVITGQLHSSSALASVSCVACHGTSRSSGLYLGPSMDSILGCNIFEMPGDAKKRRTGRMRDRYARVAWHNTRLIAVVLATAYLPIKCRRVKTNQPNDSRLQAL